MTDTQIWIITGSILILLLLSAFFSGAETALTAASKPHMHQLSKKGNRRAGIVTRLHENMERLIGTVLLANNLVNILASALATSLLIGLFEERGVAYATIVMTLLVLVFAEVLPKTFAINNADRLAINVAPTLRFMMVVLSPFTRAVQIIVKGILRLFGVKTPADIGMISEAELRGAIDLHGGDEKSIHQERAMLRSILDLEDVDVGEIMIHRKDIETIDADQLSQEIIQQVIASTHSRLPLWSSEPDNIIGILHAKSVLYALNKHAGKSDDVNITELLAKPWFIPETTNLLHQLQAFRRRHEHFALVVDEYGALLGIVTLEDILEEIVGDISDEFDLIVPGVRPQSDGSYIISGDVTIRDLNRRFDWELPDEEAATLAGLVLFQAQRIPQTGQIFTFFGFRFEILRRHRNQLTSLRLTPPKITAPPEEQP